MVHYNTMGEVERFIEGVLNCNANSRDQTWSRSVANGFSHWQFTGSRFAPAKT